MSLLEARSREERAVNHPELDDLFAKIAVEDRFVSREQLVDCRNAMEAIAKVGVKRSLQDIMIDKGFLTKEEVLEILRRLVREGVRPHIGNFEILNRVGEGGMGTVYKARQVSLDRIVALKVLPPRLAKDEIFVRRFIREAKTAAKLAHKNIITILDVGESNGFHFIAMEFIDGPTVADIIERNGRIAEDEAVRICKEVGEGLSFAAHFGIVHRDIKPANIMISRDGTVKLCDMGLAKQTTMEDASVTESGAAIGTPLYMSPEQARGDVDIDGRSDIYSLGATLFFMVTGEPPFRGRTPLEILRKRLELPPPWAGELNPELSEWTCSAIQTMMATDPAHRYPGAEEMVKTLSSRGKSRSQAVVARVVRVAQRDTIPADIVARRLRRMKVNIIAGTTAVILAALSIIGLVLIARSKHREKEKTRGPATVATPTPVPTPAPVVTTHLPTPDKPPKKPTPPPEADPNAEMKAEIMALIKKAKYAGASSLLDRLPASEEKSISQTRKAIVHAAEKTFEARKKQADALVEEGKLEDAAKIYNALKGFGIPEIAALADEELKNIRILDELEREKEFAAVVNEYKKVVAKIQEFVDKKDYDGGIAYCEGLLKDSPGKLMRRCITVEKTGMELLKGIRERAEHCGERMAGQDFTISGMTGKIVGAENGNIKLDIRGAPFSKPLDKLKPSELLALALGGEEDAADIHLMRGVFTLYHGDPSSAKEELNAARVKGEKKAADFLHRIEMTEASALDGEAEKLVQQARDLFEKRQWQDLVALGEKIKLTYGDTETFQKNQEEIERLVGRANVCFLAWGEKDMILIKAGKFRYQKDEERNLPAFLIDKYEVTNQQYKTFVDYIAKTGDHSFCYKNEPKNKDHVPLGFADETLNKPDQPAVGLDWYDAYAYAACVFKRLPTEAEWEKAARGEKGWLYPWGNEPDEARMVTGSELDGTQYPVAVNDARFANGASPFGILHALGNAAEWTEDWFDELKTGRVVRGGGWNTRPANASLTTLWRESQEPTLKKLSVGLRCDRTAK